MNLSTATPVEIDTELARLYGEEGALRTRRDSIIEDLHRVAGDKKVHSGRSSRWGMTLSEALDGAREAATKADYTGSSAQRTLNSFHEIATKLADNEREANPFRAEFDRRGGWTRAFLVVSNGQGHVHRSMSCSTCYPTTVFHWVIEFSGKDEAEVVEAAGERACTVCYPSAPVDVLKRPSRIFSTDEIAAQKAREEREAAKVARDAKKLAAAITPDGSELKITDAHGHREYFKTERAATTWLVQSIGHHRAYGYTASPAAEQTVIEALAAKHGRTVEEVTDEIEAKVKAWIKRNA
jgi:hypothetical protein